MIKLTTKTASPVAMKCEQLRHHKFFQRAIATMVGYFCAFIRIGVSQLVAQNNPAKNLM